jgi:hypothetical protein
MSCPVSVQERLRGWRCRGRLFACRPYIGSRVRLTGGHGAHSSRRGGVLSPRPPTVLGMVMQCPGWCWGRQGWPHRTDGDGGDRSRWPDVTALSLCGRDVVVRFPFEAPPSIFEGAARRSYGSGWHSATGLLLAMPHSVTQWRGWPHRGSWRNSAGA